MNNIEKTTENAGKIRSSIANRLGVKLFFRLLGIFFGLNIMIIIIAALALAFYSENRVTSALELLIEHEAPEQGVWSDFAGIRVRALPELSVGGDVDWPFTRYLPFDIQQTVRGFRAQPGGLQRTLHSITYVVGIATDDGAFEVELHIGRFIIVFFYALVVLMVLEFIVLLSQIVDDRKMIRKSLEPISEFAKAAQSFSEINQQFNHEKMMALAGKLDGIDAGHLDARIQVDDMHEELRNVADAINGMLDRINESYAAQARFVSDASHELRTPIAVIQGYANLLDRWGKEDVKTLTESVTAIKDEAESMKELVEQLLFLARGDSNRISLVEEHILLADIIEEVVSETQMLGAKQSINVSTDKTTVLADRTLIKQALRILVDNAIKYTDSDGQITIAATHDGVYAKLSVEDNGIGISPDVLPNVFDRFVRADESRARATGGAGLGLSIAQWIAARHKGHMEVLSREGIGTKITFVLPAMIEHMDIVTVDDTVFQSEVVSEAAFHSDLPPQSDDHVIHL
ncbi:MAG: HAMP domain-containing histidine kinase [Oscillospiraceae bacterium]|nr:HAMP domain-containing histidine kinase [Oscillospiraceae bacterium]